MKLQILKEQTCFQWSQKLSPEASNTSDLPPLPTGKSILARGLSQCPEGWGWALPPGAEPSEPYWVPTGFRVAGPDSAHKGTSALLAERARCCGWTGYAIPAFW